MTNIPANVDGLKKLRQEARRFAATYVAHYRVQTTSPVWRKYLFDLCTNIVANLDHSIMWNEETPGRSRLEFHYELLQFLNSRQDLALEENERLRILAAYAAHKKTSLLQIMNQHLSNQGNQFVAFLAQLTVKDYPQLLKGKCLEIGGVEAYPFYDSLCELLKPEQWPEDFIFAQKGAVKTEQTKLRKIQYDYHQAVPENNFSAIFIPRTFHWAINKHETLEHLKKSLHPNGRLFIADLNKYSSPEEVNPMEVSATFIPGFVEGNGFLDHHECVKLLQEHGFTIEKDFTFGQGPVNVSYVLVARVT